MGAESFWEHYDEIFADKDYASEATVIVPLLGAAETLFDIGCGTGNHAQEFAKYGLRVTGIDHELAVILKAQEKEIPDAVFEQMDFPNASFLPARFSFDAAVSLFNVINYILVEEDLLYYFQRVHALLQPGSVFVFDCWNGEEVARNLPSAKAKNGLRSYMVSLDKEAKTVHMAIEGTINRTRIRYSYVHRLWTAVEILEAVKLAGFANCDVRRWMQPKEIVHFGDRKMMFTARKSCQL